MNQVALITGSAKRLGKSISMHLATLGWDLALHYHTSDKAAKILQEDLQKLYPSQKFELFKSNLQNPIEVESLMIDVIGVYSRLNLLVNNAAIFEASSIRDTTFELLDRQMMVNFRTPFLLIREFAKLAKKGVIINMVDTRLTNNKSDFATYSLSKKALWELTKMAAVEFAPDIRVNAIAPGVSLPPEDRDESYIWNLANKIPMQRPGGVEPILRSLDYILDNDHLTGQLLFCDGGENLV